MRGGGFRLVSQDDDSPESKRSWLKTAVLILIGLVAGTILGLAFAWLVSPVVFSAVGPNRLNESYKAEYILLVGRSYAADGDWERAQNRLEALDDADIGETIAAQIEAYVRNAQPAPVIQGLALLAERLDARNPAVDVFAPRISPERPEVPAVGANQLTPTLPPPPSPTVLPMITPARRDTPTSEPPTAVPSYILLSREQVCRPETPVALMEVIILDVFQDPVPGVEVNVLWEGDSDHFYTGFKPEKGLGYGDFTMSPGVSYSLTLAGKGQVISEMSMDACPENQGGQAGGWRLTFQQIDS